MTELWQEYDEQGRQVPGRGLTKRECMEGALHGASHVWIWLRVGGQVEVMLQMRGAGALTWRNHLDISAAGHIDLGEQPLAAALRETQEEIGVNLQSEDLACIGVRRARITDESGIIENEFQWLYLAELKPGLETKIDDHEVHSIVWRPLEQFHRDVTRPGAKDRYVPHSRAYYQIVLEAIKLAAARKSA